jgi:hypothetical protein
MLNECLPVFWFPLFSNWFLPFFYDYLQAFHRRRYLLVITLFPISLLVFILVVEYLLSYWQLLFCCQLIILNQFLVVFILFVEYLCLVHFANRLESFYFVNLNFKVLKTISIANYLLNFKLQYLIWLLAIVVRLAFSSINSNIVITQDWN